VSGDPSIARSICVFSPRKELIILRDQYESLSLYTIRALGIGRLYIVNEPQLISAIQRQQRAFTFQAVQDKSSSRICDLSPAAIAVQKRGADAWLEGPAHAPSPSALAFIGLKPGRYLDEMNRMVVQAMRKTLETMVTGSGQSVGLFEWIKEVITISTTKGVYGCTSPCRDAKSPESFLVCHLSTDNVEP
jgi:hypothetical protein